VLPAGDTWLADTWATGEHVGEIESLAVVPSRRGAAWGADFSATSSTHAMAGASTTTSSAFSGNTAALRRLSAIGLQARVDLLTNRPDDSDERPRTTTCATKALWPRWTNALAWVAEAASEVNADMLLLW